MHGINLKTKQRGWIPKDCLGPPKLDAEKTLNNGIYNINFMTEEQRFVALVSDSYGIDPGKIQLIYAYGEKYIWIVNSKSRKKFCYNQD